MNLKDLRKEISYQWKIQTINKLGNKAQCVAYIDARDVMNLLDEVVGPDNWQDKYENIGGKFIAGIGIRCGNDWIWKFDTGTEGNFEQEKSLFSDAFKRAAVKWGIGRFLYDLEIKWVNVNNKQPIDDKGNVIWDLTKHFNGKTQTTTANQVPTQTASKEPIEDVSHTCSECDDAISTKVYEFSMNRFNKPLCMKHQKAAV